MHAIKNNLCEDQEHAVFTILNWIDNNESFWSLKISIARELISQRVLDTYKRHRALCQYAMLASSVITDYVEGFYFDGKADLYDSLLQLEIAKRLVREFEEKYSSGEYDWLLKKGFSRE